MAVLPIALLLWLAAADGGAPARAPSLLAPIPPLNAAPSGDRTYELRRGKDGDLVYDSPGFTAHIARDGTARFVDKHFTIMPPWAFLAPVSAPRGPTLQSTIKDLLAHRPPKRGARAEGEAPSGPPSLVPQMSPYRPDPSEICRYPRPCFFEAKVVLIGVTGTFDLTDEIMRLHGEDPYRREKAHFLAATSTLRGGLAARALAENIRRASSELPATLEAIACDETRSVRDRRATIEALRDEIAGDTPAARAAVATIEAFLAGRFEGRDGGVSCGAR
jgi:hypothetical protein